MSNDIKKFINDALNQKGQPTHCAGCKRRILSADDLGTAAYWLDNTSDAAEGSNNFYPVCERCLPKVGKPTFTKRCERRIEHDPLKYTLTIALPADEKYLPVSAPYMPFFGTDQRDDWVASDRDWFAAHPTRTHLIRHPFPGEIEQMKKVGLIDVDSKVGAVIVMQLEPGKRVRGINSGEFSSADIAQLNKSDANVMPFFTDGQHVHAEGMA